MTIIHMFLSIGYHLLSSRTDRGIESQASYDFVTKLVAQIIKNLEIRIENIHICYEDKFTNPKRPFSIG